MPLDPDAAPRQSPPESITSSDFDAVVVGAGVIGLTVAVCLAEMGLRVHVYSRDESEATTSAVASAMVGPSMTPDPVVGAWERDAIAEFTALAAIEGTGVRMRRGRLASRQTASLPGLGPCPEDSLPPGFTGASTVRLPIVEMPVYLNYLTRRLHTAGGRLDRRELRSLADVAGEAPLLANCSGLGARELVPDTQMRPVSGQQVIVENPGLREFFLSSPFEPEWTAYWPHPSKVVLGGSQIADDENIEPRAELAEAIVARCCVVEPRLRHAQVIGHQVGLRPSRPAVRLETETVGGTRCVHNYGHGGAGVTLSWGTARESVARLVRRAR